MADSEKLAQPCVALALGERVNTSRMLLDAAQTCNMTSSHSRSAATASCSSSKRLRAEWLHRGAPGGIGNSCNTALTLPLHRSSCELAGQHTEEDEPRTHCWSCSSPLRCAQHSSKAAPGCPAKRAVLEPDSC